ncbi:hypothetical protein Tco_0113989, partial [Tanacetum coccineum]
MENANLPPTSNRPVIPVALRAQAVQELHEHFGLYNDSDDGEVFNELIEYENVGMLRRERAINSFDGDDLAFQ